MAHFYFELRSRWHTQVYRNDISFLRRYLVSDLAKNAADIVDKEPIFDMVMPLLTETDMAVLADRIMESKLAGADHAIREVYGNDQTKGRALVAALDPSQLGCKIERTLLERLDERESPSIFNKYRVVGEWQEPAVVSAIGSIDPCKEEQIVLAINISELARHFENASIWKCASAMKELPKANPTLWRLLLDAIDVSPIASRFLNADELMGATQE